MRWNDWNTMPILRRRNRASASSSSVDSVSPATITVPVSGRSSPAMTIRSVDFPEPDGPTIPIASPWPILRSMSFRIWTRAAPRPSERLTPASRMAGPAARAEPEVSFMRSVLPLPVTPGHVQLRSYGRLVALVQIVAWLAAFGALLVPPIAGAADQPVRIVALGDSLTAGHGVPAGAA